MMKKGILIFLTLFFVTNNYCFAQGNNLQFSKSLFIELEGSPVSGVEIVDNYTLSIPENKTVKIESASLGVTHSNITYPNIPDFDLGGHIFLNGKLLHFAGNEISNTFFPIWLPEGNYLFELVGDYDNNQPTFKAYISGIEFNIVQ